VDPFLQHLVSSLEAATLAFLKNHVFQDDHRDTTEAWAELDLALLASNRPNRGPFLCSIEFLVGTAAARISGKVTPHTLRHTFASRLAMKGVNSLTLQLLGRWEEPKMLQRYAHLSSEHLAEALEKNPGSEEFHSAFHSTRKTTKSEGFVTCWCGRGDLNPHGLATART
jgi:hypothetical protein